MAPLGRLWSSLEESAKSGEGTCDLKEIMELVEQSVLLLGQASVAADHNIRLNMMSCFLRDPKKAGDILRKNTSLFLRDEVRTDLFGRPFYKALHKRAKGATHCTEITNKLS